MSEFLTSKVLVYLFALSVSVSCLASDLLIPKRDHHLDPDFLISKRDRWNRDDDGDKKDDDDDDDDDNLGIYIAVGVIGSAILILIAIFCLCRLRRRQNKENSASSKTVLAVVPRPRHLNNSISNESYSGPTCPPSTYGSASAPYEYSNNQSYQNPAFDGYTGPGQFEAPPPYFEHPQIQEETISVGIPGKQ